MTHRKSSVAGEMLNQWQLFYHHHYYAVVVNGFQFWVLALEFFKKGSPSWPWNSLLKCKMSTVMDSVPPLPSWGQRPSLVPDLLMRDGYEEEPKNAALLLKVLFSAAGHLIYSTRCQRVSPFHWARIHCFHFGEGEEGWTFRLPVSSPLQEPQSSVSVPSSTSIEHRMSEDKQNAETKTEKVTSIQQ